MKYPKINAVRAKFLSLGVDISADDAKMFLDQLDRLPHSALEVGDFVEISEGMGNIRFAKIEKIDAKTIEVRTYNEGKGTYQPYLSEYQVGEGQYWRMSSETEADAFYKIMTTPRKS